jgi:hypothetical protein
LRKKAGQAVVPGIALVLAAWATAASVAADGRV